MAFIDDKKQVVATLYDALGNALLFDSQAARVSLYGNNAVAGDISLRASSAGRLFVNVVENGLVGDNESTGRVFDTQGGLRPMAVGASLFNGTDWDRQRANIEATLLASAARTATPNNTETLTLAIQIKDPVSGKYQNLTGFAALLSSTLGASPTTATYVYTLYPGAVITAAATNNVVQGLALPRTWRVQATHSSTTSWTYSVGSVTLL